MGNQGSVHSLSLKFCCGNKQTNKQIDAILKHKQKLLKRYFTSYTTLARKVLKVVMSSCFKILKSLLKNCRVQERRYKKSAENQGAVSVSTLREKKVNMWNKKGFTEYHI